MYGYIYTLELNVHTYITINVRITLIRKKLTSLYNESRLTNHIPDIADIRFKSILSFGSLEFLSFAE